MDAAFEHVARQPGLVLLTAIGAIGPDIAGSVAGVDYPAQLAPVAVCSRGHRRLPDEPKAPIDADMRLL